MASPAAKGFQEFSEGVVADFLQTIMVVDDQAFFPDKPEEFKQLKTPGAPAIRKTSRSRKTPMESQRAGNEFSDAPSSRDKAHELNAKKLIEDFAVKGIVC